MAKKKTFPGSIYKPANANTLYINFKGKRVATGLQATKEGYQMAQIFLEKLYKEYHGLNESYERVSYKYAWGRYFQTLVNNTDKTKLNYSYSFAAIVGDEADDFLSSASIENKVIKYLKTTKHSRVSINTYLNQFQIFINYCVKNKWTDDINVMSKYSFPKQKQTGRSYTKSECDRIIYYFMHNYPEIGYLIFFMLETGARDIDALTLEWSQINFSNKTIEWKNKISKEIEIRPASDKAFKILKILKKKNKKKVFSYSYSSMSTIAKKLNKALKTLDIDKNKRSFQEFRVTFRMRLASRGVPKEISEYLLRHSSAKLIDLYYTDFSEFEERIRGYLNMKLSNGSQAW